MPLLFADTMHTISSPLMWVGFVLFVLLATAVDLNLGRHSLTMRAALTWCVVWIVAALIFASGLWHFFGVTHAEEFLAGYLLEKSLSVDNLFVFVLIFGFFRTPPNLQHRALVWGIVGAMILRAIMILSGAALIARFNGVMVLFGAFLIYTGIKLLVADEDADPSESKLIQLMQRKLPLTDDYVGEHFATRIDGRFLFTRLFLVVLAIEFSDVIFAVDSVPAIFGVTQDPFIVFTSNIFAILGLRALFFAIAGAIQQLHYLNYGLSVVLSFIGVKMILPFIPGGPHVSTSVSLAVICVVLGVTIGLSLMVKRSHADEAEDGAEQPERAAVTPTEATPTEAIPAEPAPAEATPAESTPAESTPAEPVDGAGPAPAPASAES